MQISGIANDYIPCHTSHCRLPRSSSCTRALLSARPGDAHLSLARLALPSPYAPGSEPRESGTRMWGRCRSLSRRKIADPQGEGGGQGMARVSTIGIHISVRVGTYQWRQAFADQTPSPSSPS